MASDVTVDTSEVEGALVHLGNRARSFNQSLITMLLAEYVDDVFDSEGRMGRDGPFKELEDSTIARHPRRAGGQILLDTGLLGNMQSATRGDMSIVWSPASYAPRHVKGTENMVRRNPFAIRIDKFTQEAELLIATEIAG